MAVISKFLKEKHCISTYTIELSIKKGEKTLISTEDLNNHWVNMVVFPWDNALFRVY